MQPNEAQLVQTIQAAMPDEELLLDVSDLFKTFADSTRIKILAALSVSSLCVNDIAAVLGTTISAVSHQLRLLRIAKLVKTTRRGKEVYYALDDDHVHDLYAIAIEHLTETRK